MWLPRGAGPVSSQGVARRALEHIVWGAASSGQHAKAHGGRAVPAGVARATAGSSRRRAPSSRPRAGSSASSGSSSSSSSSGPPRPAYGLGFENGPVPHRHSPIFFFAWRGCRRRRNRSILWSLRGLGRPRRKHVPFTRGPGRGDGGAGLADWRAAAYAGGQSRRRRPLSAFFGPASSGG